MNRPCDPECEFQPRPRQPASAEAPIVARAATTAASMRKRFIGESSILESRMRYVVLTDLLRTARAVFCRCSVSRFTQDLYSAPTGRMTNPFRRFRRHQ
jgi:hypothetical protein